ncbi:vascular endothelial growth factor D isoform X1 [Denticeps clupeoides]|uniref:vascular endothelial growth factor D isoform X1 n=1 Tax=Denticeps clupeoides TaxID=299321 RepID=UPI0010A4C95C|nr:vascular endothelial growth factor D isoform X1 [Denticeps clupeoides]XP_028836507.1 vascular endothelial growth factor D isoform X1 [Denticeps clupeoides]XP_028836509.1 vascular endothelial growth factor D isoform X1 [Denticeps clupeoides]
MQALFGVFMHVLLTSSVKLMVAVRDHRQSQWAKEVKSASSLDEFLRLTDFPDWKLWKCRMKLKNLDSSSASDLRPSSPGSHRATRYASASYSLDILKAIDEEWQKTQCMPRETCVDVATELGTTAELFFKPPCVSVFRCNGCCNKEGVTCRNTSTTYINKTLLSVIPFRHGPEPVLVKVANHTECSCLEPPLIRRHTTPRRTNWCSPLGHSVESHRLCDRGMIWDCMEDRCVPYPSTNSALKSSPSVKRTDCEIDVNNCECSTQSNTSHRGT